MPTTSVGAPWQPRPYGRQRAEDSSPRSELIKPIVKPKTNMSETVNVACYKSKTLKDGSHPLMVRVCKDGKKKYQSIGISTV